MSMLAFTTVLVLGGWAWGEAPDAALLATASGTAVPAAIAVGQMANAFACRSSSVLAWRLPFRSNPLRAGGGRRRGAAAPRLRRGAVGGGPARRLVALGDRLAMAGSTAVVLLLADGGHKWFRGRGRRRRASPGSHVRVGARPVVWSGGR